MSPAQGYKVSGQGQPLVLLHSSLSSSGQWAHLVTRLQKHFLCINIDLLGYGEAPAVSDSEQYSLKDETDRIIDILNQHIGEAPFVLIGHSFGGAVALRLAYLMATRISQMVLYEPVAFHLIRQNPKAFDDIYQISSQLDLLSDEQAARSFVDYWNYPGFFAEKPLKIRNLFTAHIGKVKLDFKGLMAEQYGIADLRLENCPVLLMDGRHSPLSSRTIASMLAKQLPDVKHQEFDGGHMAPIQDAKAVAQVIYDYLTASGSSAAL